MTETGHIIIQYEKNQQKNRIFKRIIKKYPQKFLKYLGFDYEFIKLLDSIELYSTWENSKIDILMHVKERIDKNPSEENEYTNLEENSSFILHIEIRKSLVNRHIACENFEYASETYFQYRLPSKIVIISADEPKSKPLIMEIILDSPYTITIISLSEKSADECLNKITKKVENNEELNPYDLFDLIFLQFMTSSKYNQAELYEFSLRLVKEAKIDAEDRQEITDLLYLYLEDIVKMEEYEKVREDLMTGTISRYIQDEKNQTKDELMNKIVVNLLKENKDINFIQRITNLPPSKIKSIAQNASLI